MSSDLDRFSPPDDDEPETVATCVHCGGEIYEGDMVRRSYLGDIVHADCSDEYAVKIAFDYSGVIDENGNIN